MKAILSIKVWPLLCLHLKHLCVHFDMYVLQLKQMEIQLEEEYEDKQKVLRDRRELESKLLMTQDQVLP